MASKKSEKAGCKVFLNCKPLAMPFPQQSYESTEPVKADHAVNGSRSTEERLPQAWLSGTSLRWHDATTRGFDFLV